MPADARTTPAAPDARRGRFKPPLPGPKGSRPKPTKPYPDFPLFPHAAGVWAKKIRGKLYYFGPWEDPDGALAKYLVEKDDLHAGRKPRPDPTAATVKDAANTFLNAKQAAVDNGELSPLTWADYKEAADEVVAVIGKGRLLADLGPDDFAALRNRMAKKWGPHHLKKAVQCIRCLLKHALDTGLVDRPVRLGPDFRAPSKKVIRLHRAKQGPKLFTAEEVRKLLDAAGVQLRAMILLAVNAGLGNADCGRLTVQALDLERAWLDYPRPKTGMPRRCPLWPETVAALEDALARRKEPKNAADAGLVFVTRTGQAWFSDARESPVSCETAKLLKKVGINGHRNFYALRHTFRTVADGAKDQPAADYIMGHEVPHMSSVYRETISDERLRAVTDHVRAWLFRPENAAATSAAAPAVDTEARGLEL
jgi:integrase